MSNFKMHIREKKSDRVSLVECRYKNVRLFSAKLQGVNKIAHN